MQVHYSLSYATPLLLARFSQPSGEPLPLSRVSSRKNIARIANAVTTCAVAKEKMPAEWLLINFNMGSLKILPMQFSVSVSELKSREVHVGRIYHACFLPSVKSHPRLELGTVFFLHVLLQIVFFVECIVTLVAGCRQSVL